jgi:molecular chaperone DnaJ
MKLQKAYEILGLSNTATPEEAKKKFRELSKIYHPDVNKNPDAEKKFKEINEAYQCVSTGKGTDPEDLRPNPFDPRSPFGSPFGSPFHININPFGREIEIEAVPISLGTRISFKDSILGCKQELKYRRQGKCYNCNGQGQVKQNSGCQKCGGRGVITAKKGNMIFSQTCDQCFGRSPVFPCSACSSTGVTESDVSVNVTIPGGISDGNMLRLGGMGNYSGSFMNMDQFTDVFLKISVEPEPGMSLVGKDVVSSIDVTLLEALRGCKRKVKTVLGDHKIEVKPLSKNKDEVVIPNMGVERIGNHRIILNIKYPKNINKLIDVLIDEEF